MKLRLREPFEQRKLCKDDPTDGDTWKQCHDEINYRGGWCRTPRCGMSEVVNADPRNQFQLPSDRVMSSMRNRSFWRGSKLFGHGQAPNHNGEGSWLPYRANECLHFNWNRLSIKFTISDKTLTVFSKWTCPILRLIYPSTHIFPG